jgi:sensor histidine kinase YesM
MNSMGQKKFIPLLRTSLIKLAGKRLFQHLLFWTASFLFLLNYFSSAEGIRKIDLIYTALFHASLLMTVYLNIWLLIPHLLSKGRYLIYLVSVLLLICLSALFNQLTFDHLVDLVLPGYFFISYYDLDDILKFIFVYAALSGLLKLSKGWFLLMQTEQQLMKLRQEKTETELRALKSQINPHFLFNSLNNIYSLALNGSKNSAKAILKLSELMRYMLYESNDERVALEQEIRFIDNYIELQRLRADQKSRIDYSRKGPGTGLSIAPLIFLPFIENAFKHGIKGDPSGGFVKLDLGISTDSIELLVSNNKGNVDRIEKDEFNGIGLNNVRRRLELIYPGRYDLQIEDLGEIFKVRLKLSLQ